MNKTLRLAPLPEAFDAVRAWLEGEEADPPVTAADEIAALFGLDEFGRNLLLLCAFVNLEAEARTYLTAFADNPDLTAPTVAMALSLLPGAHWHALSADAPLRRGGLVTIEGQGGFVQRRVMLSEPALMRLVGAGGLSEAVAGMLRPVRPGQRLTANRQQLATRIGGRFSLPGRPVLHLVGPDTEGKLAAFASAADEFGQGAYALNSQLLPAYPAELTSLARDIARDLTLAGCRLALVHEPGAEDKLVQLFAETYPGPLAILSPEAIRVGQRPATRLELPAMTAAEQQPVWEAALGEMGARLNGTLPRLAGTFQIGPEQAESIAAELGSIPEAGGEGEDAALAEAAWEACRVAARPRMDDLAQRIDSPAGWDDLVLPDKQKDILRSITAQVRNRARVYEDWGFAPKLQNKGLGVSALFSGPSGSGKSMAGEVIGNALNLDVYRVDLSAIVSKWVGETEKNLRRVFDAAEGGGVILQFDEADALFGKRSEVRDSHDRHANIEVSYLLQRLEAYRGLSILTTNLRDNIDEAFLRRIRFCVDFRFPSVPERLAIWQRIFPKATPTEALDFTRLAQLNVSGGSIRNIALGASFLAADEGASVTMDTLMQAARQEYAKVGRSMTDAEAAGWQQ